MDPRYGQQYGYANQTNTQYPQQQPQNGYQQYGQAPQYPPQYQQQYPPAQVQMHHGYQAQQAQQRQPQVVIPPPQNQQYMTMTQHQQTYSPQQQYQQRGYQQSQYQRLPQQQLQYQPSPQQQPQQQQQQQQQYRHAMQSHPQQQPQPQPQHQPRPQAHTQPQFSPQPQYRAQPQVMIPQRVPSSMPHPQMSNAQMSSPNIRQVQVPVQRANNAGVSQMDGSQDVYRRQSSQQVPTPPTSRPVQRMPSHHESDPRSSQNPPSTPVQAQSQIQQQRQQQQQRPPQSQFHVKIEQQQQHQQRPTNPQVQVKTEQRPPQVQVAPQVTPQRTPSQSYQQANPIQTTPVQNTPSSHTPLPPSRPAQTTPTQETSLQHTPSLQSSSQPRSHPKVVIPRPPSHQLTSPTKAAPAQLPQKTSPADFSVMLLSAADEYIAAARSLGPTIARQKKNSDVRQYYKLMSTAMGCMDAVLRKFNMQPRDEAKLRLRYASLLVEETDNTTEIDEILSKGISLCARCRLQDLRYSMLHLQARYQYKTNSRAAFKALDKNISEAETFQQIAWVYAFRFLKVSLLLQSTDRVETIPALQQLHAITNHAEKRDDTAVAFASYAMEAMVHLRSSAQDRLIEAQRAIAQARSLQHTMSVKQQGSFGTLFSIIDLACSVHQNAPDSAKSTALLQATANENDSRLGTESGVFTVTLDRTSGGSLTTDTAGIFRKTEGRDELVFSWLPREDIKALCFHICALDQSVHEKSVQLVQEARSQIRDAVRRQPSPSLPISMAYARAQWRKVLDWHATFTLGLIAAHREDQQTAGDALASLTKRVATPPYANQPNYTQSLSYLEAIIDQTNGRFNAALATYSSTSFVLSEKNHVPALTSELAILAAMNRLLIARDPGHTDHENVGTLLSQLRLACEDHPSQYLRMAFTLVNALCTLDPSINRLKTLMNNATQKSHDMFKRTQNREFVVMSLCYFTARFFIEPVTDKSSSAANAVRQHAKQSNRPLWMAVACGLMIKVFEHNNIIAEKQKYEEIYEKVRLKLPAPLRGDDVDAEGEDDDDGMDLVP